MLENKHGPSQKAAKAINVHLLDLGETSSQVQHLLQDDKSLRRKKSSIVSTKSVKNTSSTSSLQQSEKKQKSRRGTQSISSIKPVIIPLSETCNEIKRRTGFVNEEAMMRYIILICNADLKLMEETVLNKLTWFEEWCLYFEVLWLQSHTRWEDLAVIYDKTSTQTLRRVFDSKTQIVLTCHDSWPIYASFD